MQWDNIKENGVFIGGHRKNGTTLLSALLDNHPSLFVYPYETHFWFAWFPEYIKEEYDIQYQRVIDYIFKSLEQTTKKWIGIDLDKDKLINTFQKYISASNRNTKDYFEAIMFAARETLPYPNYKTHTMFVEKTTMSEMYSSTILNMYPKAKFIQVMRDPRDNWCVIKNGWDSHYKNQYDCIERLFRSVVDRNYLSMRIAFDNKEVFQNRYCLIKYEDLVSRPIPTMSYIYDFIGLSPDVINYNPTMCGIPWKGNSFTGNNYNGINQHRVGIYHDLPTNEVKILEYYFKDMMLKLGYIPGYCTEDCLEAIRDHYKWFNHNQIYSNKPLRNTYK